MEQEIENEIYRSNLRFETSSEIATRLGLTEEQVNQSVEKMKERFRNFENPEELTAFLKEIGMTKHNE